MGAEERGRSGVGLDSRNFMFFAAIVPRDGKCLRTGRFNLAGFRSGRKWRPAGGVCATLEQNVAFEVGYRGLADFGFKHSRLD